MEVKLYKLDLWHYVHVLQRWAWKAFSPKGYISHKYHRPATSSKQPC